MTVTLREAQAKDLDALVRLEEVAFEGDRFSRRQLWHLINRANAHVLLVETPERRLLGHGILLFRRSSQRVRLYSFCVHPEARGMGIGRQLLESLEQEARRRGGERLTLEVRADNRAALALYRRMGFSLQRWLEDYYEDGCAGWQMEKPLGQTR